MRLILICFATVWMLGACSGAGSNAEQTAAAPKAPAPDAVEELPLPLVPSTMTEPTDRAAFIAEHFWDTMDFADTLRSYDEAFMEQNFANFANILPFVDRQRAQSAVDRLMKAAEADSVAYGKLADIAEKYLYDPNSPMLDEESYILFLNAITGSEFMDRDSRLRFECHLADALKNRLGSTAADFRYIDSHGAHGSLHGLGGVYKLVVFYDPDCDVCRHAKEVLRSDPAVNAAVASGKLKVLAVYTDGDREVWQRSKDDLPDNWISAYDPDGTVDRDEVYVLRATPTLYLIGPDNTVVIKDGRVEEMTAAVADI